MRSAPSPYYPPRAGLNRPLYRALDWFRLRLHLHQTGVELPHIPSLAVALRDALIPGLGFRAVGWTTLPWILSCTWIAAAFVYMKELGHPAASAALIVMLAIHAGSMASVVRRIVPAMSGLHRVLALAGIVLLLRVGVYDFAQGMMERHFCAPVRTTEKVYVIDRRFRPADLRRGDLVGFRIPRSSPRAGLLIQEGIAVNRVLAVPGDRVEFWPTLYRVNGQAFTALTLMPTAGHFVLPPDTWLIWPTLNVRNNHLSAAEVSEAIVQAATVHQGAIIGKPFKTWLWRHQNQ